MDNDQWIAALEPCKAPLHGFGYEGDRSIGLVYGDRDPFRLKVPSEKLPSPAAVELVMLILVGSYDLGGAEKLAWEYPFTFKGHACSIALQKFGLRIYVDSSAEEAPPLADAILKRISKAARKLEPILNLLADEQIAKGNVTLRNEAGHLREMYKYFRRLARDAYDEKGVLVRDFDNQEPSDNIIAAVTRVNRIFPIRREGFYDTVAMTSAYFSLLEHLLVILLPFTDFDPKEESLSDFIGAKWAVKFDRVFTPTSGAESLKFRNRLKDVAERWRNPFSHGGFDKKRGTLHFHIPGVGVAPKALAEIRNYPSIEAPGDASDFEEICQLFDEFDVWLRDTSMQEGMRWIEEGLDIHFDQKHLDELRAALCDGQEAFRLPLERTSHFTYKALNMD